MADEAGVERRLDQTVGRIAAIVLGRGKNGAAGPRRRYHDIARAHRQGQRLLAEHVLALLERRNRNRDMAAGVGDHIEGGDRGVGDCFGDGAMYARTPAQRRFCLVGGTLGTCLIDIADRDQLDIGQPGAGKRCQARNVPASHAPATDQAQRQPFHTAPPIP